VAGLEGQWVSGDGGRSYGIFQGKIMCWVEAEEKMFEWEDSDGKDFPKKLTLTVISDSQIVKSENDADFFAKAELRNPGFSDFASKWEIPIKHLRHFAKLERFLINFIFRHFDPKKSKPKNALQKFTEALSNFPQRWRAQAISESAGLPNLTLRENSEATVGSAENCDLLVPGESVHPEHFDIFNISGDFFLQVRTGQVRIDGIRNSSADGPAQLKDSNTIKIGDSAIYVQIGKDELLDERNSEEAPTKKTRLE